MESREEYQKLYYRINSNKPVNDDEIDRVEGITKAITFRAMDVLKEHDKKLLDSALKDTKAALGY